MTSGTLCVTFTLAINRRFVNAQGAREADYIPIVAWRQTAELCARYLSKGRKVCVAGSIQTRSYQAQDGSRRYATEVIADEVEFLTPSGGQAAPQQTPPPPRAPPPEQSMHQMGFTEVDEDEFPF